MSAVVSIISLAEARRAARPGVDWKLFEAFSDRVIFTSDVHEDFVWRLSSLDQGLRSGSEYAQRYWRLVAGEMARPLRATLPGEAFGDPLLDKLVVVAALLSHWTSRHAPPLPDRINVKENIHVE